jgi:hypothetical protein
MATIDITEYSSLAMDAQGRIILVGQEPSRTNQQLTPGVSSTQSAAFDDATRFVRLHTDANCRWAIGPNPTASSTSPRLPAGVTEYIGVRPGHKIAVIQSS